MDYILRDLENWWLEESGAWDTPAKEPEREITKEDIKRYLSENENLVDRLYKAFERRDEK